MKAFEKIAQIIFPQGKLRRVWPLMGGISAGMMALAMETANGRSHKIIVRSHQHPGVAQNEFRLLRQLNALGLAVPVPYHLDLSGRILAAPYLVIGYSEGEMDFAPADLADTMRQMAAKLAQIHRVETGDLSFLPQARRECAELARPYRQAHGEPFTPSISLFDETRIRAALAAQLPPTGNPAALLHGDFWPGNCLWRDGRLTAIIDWEDAQLGDPLIDLAQSRSEIVWIFGRAAMELFTQHYQSLNDLDCRQLPYWDLCAVLRFLRLASGDLAGFAAYFAGYGRADITETTIRQDIRFFIEQAMDRLAE